LIRIPEGKLLDEIIIGEQLIIDVGIDSLVRGAVETYEFFPGCDPDKSISFVIAVIFLLSKLSQVVCLL
jgi:hypothetical protein